MSGKDAAYFDIETVTVMRETLEHAWASLHPGQRARTQKSALAERILAAAAHGERDRARLFDAALDLAA